MTKFSEGKLTADQRGRVLVLTISNPSARNALTRSIFDSGLSVVSQLRRDRSIGAVVLVGDGEHFCGGGNLHRMQEQRSKPPHTQAEHVDAAHAWITAMRECPQPVIAAVEGASAGGGFALALACDLIVAARNANFIMSHVKIGLTPDCGATYWLARSVPRQLALEIMLGGESVPAQRLLELGLINRIVDSGDALNEAMKWAQKLSEGPFNAQARIKHLHRLAEVDMLRTQLAEERDSVVEAVYGPENTEGVDAFLGRRPPNFAASNGR